MLAHGLVAALAALLIVLAGAGSAMAQKQGGTLRIYHRDNPPSASLHEESTVSVTQPFMAVFNNLVLFDQTKPLNSPETIVPDLAASWSWDASNTKLTFKLREGVKWHDGKPFTAKDVQCTWHALLGKGGHGGVPPEPPQGLVLQPEGGLDQRRPRSDVPSAASATLVRGMLLASGFSPVYPCHVSQKARCARSRVGTGPFKFVELNRNVSIKLVRNPDYWKKGNPTLMPSRCASSTAGRRASWHSYRASST